MRLEISYHTRYEYEPPIRDSTTALRIRPVTRPGLTVISSAVTANPGRIAARYLDGWGTQVDVVDSPGLHDGIMFDLKATVETHAPEFVQVLTSAERYWYGTDSARVRRSAVDSLGWQLVGPSWIAVESALAWMPQRFVYEVGATDALTPVERVIEIGAGVCQDFAHVLLALLRSWGFCARYVSGYFFSASAETERIEADAMHAWVQVYRPGLGWVGLDATTGAYTDDRYVPVGFGRDYDDVRPIRGVLHGSAQQRQEARIEQVQQQQ
ncbi:MAG TPA: transglutaminase family protein [Tepidiformaceae bacterium]|nr:transglutaminase family protein [Tepidiformaceae bacterium]